MSCDPNFADVILLAHLDGTNGSAGPFIDDSPLANTLTTVGGAVLDTATPKFGPSDMIIAPSGAFNGFSVPDSGPFDFSTGDWTIEFQAMSTVVSGNIHLARKFNFTSVYPYEIILAPGGGAASINADGADSAGSGVYAITGGTNFTFNVWHAVCLERFGNIFTLYLDGVIQGTQPTYSGALGNNNGTTKIGADASSETVQIDEVRYTRFARYGATAYTPATAAFPDVACTTTTVPNVVGEDIAVATANIISANLVVGTITTFHDSIIPAGQITAQSPVGGVIANFGDPVDLTECLGAATFPIPDVINTGVAVAESTIEAAGFTVGSVTFVADVLIIPGNIVHQSPVGGTFKPLGFLVNLVVSTGRAGLFVPDLTGLTAAQADNALVTIGLVTNTVSFAPSLLIPAGEVFAQNPGPGTPVGYGSLVSYVISTGLPTPFEGFDFEATVISQYANSPTILQLVSSMNDYIDQGANFANFYAFVWNVDTAQGFGLDVWGKIVNVSRLLQIPNSNRYVGFQDGTGPGPSTDVEPFGQEGIWFTPLAATEGYLLQDAPYRQLILTKALANILNTTIPAFNQLLQNLFPGRGNPYVYTSGEMAMTFVFDFVLTPIELAILQQSGAVPVPPGVSFTIVTP